MHRYRWPGLLWAIVLTFLAPALRAEEPAAAKPETKAKPGFLRVLRNSAGDPIALQTAVVRYVSADDRNPGLTVDLVGAVHIADKEYYDQLNKSFEKYEALLFELVAPEGTKIPQGGARDRGFNPVSGMQRGMQSMLDLEFQLDCIDYTKPNLVHADMSPDEFAKSMKDRKESMLQIIFRAMGQGAAQQGKSSDAELLMALFAKDRPFRLKRAMASQFENLEAQMAVIEGKDGSTIISERNKKALEVLKKEIAAGKKNLGIFYGAGHLPDMEERLLKDFGLKRDSETWLTAWTMERTEQKPAKPAKEAAK